MRQPADGAARLRAGGRRSACGEADEARLLQHAQLALALQWPLAQDSVQPAQWLALSPRSLAEFFTLCDERLYQSVGHAHLLSYVWGGGAKDGAHPKRAPPQQGRRKEAKARKAQPTDPAREGAKERGEPPRRGTRKPQPSRAKSDPERRAAPRKPRTPTNP